MDTELPLPAELSSCAAVLRRLRPQDLQLPELAEVLETGVALFRRHIIKEKFGSGDAVAFLKEKSKVNKKIAELKRLHAVVTDVHETRKKQAEECGMNVARKAALAAIKEESALPPAPPQAICISDEAQVPADETLASADGYGSPGPETGKPAGEAAEAPGDTPISAEADDTAAYLRSLPPPDDFHSHCNMCRGEYLERHHFYHQLCPRCAELNWEKRNQTADMTGMVCVVTGGRVRIGYQIVLKLLRAGAFVLTTTRYPSDCALRYSREADFEIWKQRLEVCGPVELADMRLVERFCDQLADRFPRIHVLINNAAQTITRLDGWKAKMASLEYTASTSLPASAETILRHPAHVAGSETRSLSDAQTLSDDSALVPAVRSSKQGQRDPIWLEAAAQEHVAEGELDESRQPLDLSRANSWSRRLGSISTLELLQTLAANTAAPFIMCSRLVTRLAPSSSDDPYGHIINVSALEGKFSVKKKSNGHPHTNMAKAALNMLTHTSASELFQRRVLCNCVDTGWVTDMAPGGVGAVAATHEAWIGPPLDEEDGAARVLDPIFLHLNDPSWLVRGKFFKNYFVAGW